MRQGWEYKKLNEVCDKGSSNIVINKLADNNGDYPLYGASGLVKNVDFYHQDRPYIGIVKDGAGVGRVNTYPAYSSLVGTMQYIFPKEDYDLNYVKYFLVKQDLSHLVSGATIPHIYFKDYGKELIPVPDKYTQLAIVSELDKINELIRLKKEQLKDYDYLAQSIFNEMFGDPEDGSSKYETAKLDDVFSIITDGTHQTPTYTEDKEHGYKFLSAKDVTTGTINWENIKYIPDYLHEELYKRLAPQRNDILLCKNGTTGICALVETDEIFDIYVSLALLRPREGYIPKYLVHAINHPSTKRQFDASLKGIGVPNLHLKEIKKTKIVTPPLSLQQTFASRIEVIERQKAEIQKTIKGLETLLASRMQFWFDVNEAADAIVSDYDAEKKIKDKYDELYPDGHNSLSVNHGGNVPCVVNDIDFISLAYAYNYILDNGANTFEKIQKELCLTIDKIHFCVLVELGFISTEDYITFNIPL